MSVLLSVTSDILTKCATMTNTLKFLDDKRVTKCKSTTKAIRLATNKMITAHKKQKNAVNSKFKSSAPKARLKESIQRYHKVDDIFFQPSKAYAYIKSCRSVKPKKIELLTVMSFLWDSKCVMASTSL